MPDILVVRAGALEAGGVVSGEDGVVAEAGEGFGFNYFAWRLSTISLGQGEGEKLSWEGEDMKREAYRSSRGSCKGWILREYSRSCPDGGPKKKH